MPLFRQSLKEKYTPKKLKFSSLYQHNTKTAGHGVGVSVLTQTKAALKRAGYSDSRIAEIITKDRPIPVADLREVAAVLNRSRVYGFDRDQKMAVDRLLNKERVKAQSIANIRKEQILEAAEETLASPGTTSLNRKGISPNQPKPGEASFGSRKRTGNAVFSLSGKASTKPISSLSDRPVTSSLVSPSSSRFSPGTGASLKPKF